jgi:DNA repair exonuclease SbcCD nuclease subunit
MSSSKYAIFTDLHLGVHQNSSTWHGIALKWADWFVNDLKEKGIKDILFLGDFFHSRSEISVNTIHASSELLTRFIDFNLHMIVGNHDSYYKQKSDIHSLSILTGYPNISIYDKTTTKNIGNKTVTFCPWGFQYSEIEKSDIIFGHFEIESFKMNAHKLCEVGVKPKELLKKAKVIFSGHFHLNEEREYDDGKIIYVGSPFQLDFGERETQKGYYIIDFDDLTYNFYRNEVTPVHKRLLVSEMIEGEDIKDDIKDIVKDNFVKIVVDKQVDQKILDKFIHICSSFSPLSMIVDPLINFEIANDLKDSDLSGIDISKAIVDFVNLLDIKEIYSRSLLESI